MSGGIFPGGHVRGNMFGGICPGGYVQGICPGEYVPGNMSMGKGPFSDYTRLNKIRLD